MRLALEWNGEITPIDIVPGVVFVGGGPRDGIRLDGIEPSLLTLNVSEADVQLTARCPVRIGGLPFPPHVPRLMLPGERVEVSETLRIRRVDDAARTAKRASVSTAFVAKSLLSGDLPAAETRAATISCVTGPDSGAVFPLGHAENVIGREAGAAVQLRERTVSRRHAVVRLEAGVYAVYPLEGRNGLVVNGRRLTERHVLRTGDIIECGRSQLRFDAPAGSEVPVEVAPRPVVPPRVFVAEPSDTPVVAPLQRTSHDVLVMCAGAVFVVLGAVVALLAVP
ncbi:MAG: FHA domain-containing protein [Archangium sp.]|nr:FHA domain-containing protein [Archangium sp.]